MRFRLFLGFVCLVFLPRLAMAGPPCGIPFAFVNGTVIDAGQMNSNFNQVATCIGSAAANNATNINQGTLAAQFGGTGTSSWTPGSVVFASSVTQLGQDNANFFWNASSHSLGIGTGNPGYQLDVVGNGHLTGGLFLENNAAVFFKTTGGQFWNALQLDNGNNLLVGSTNFGGQILFFNGGAQHANLDTLGRFGITGGSANYFINGAQISCASLSNAAASCSTNTANAANITSGTLPPGRLSGAYNIGNLQVSNTFGGGGGNIGLDNGEALLLKDTGATYRNGVQIDGANNLDVGDTSWNGSICFRNAATACGAFVGTDGGVHVNTGAGFHSTVGYFADSPAFFQASNAQVLYNNSAAILKTTAQTSTYLSAADNGQILVSANSGNYQCVMNSTASGLWACTSDAELKDWQPLAMARVVPGAKAGDSAIAAILKLRPVSYTWKNDAEKRLNIGFLAQDVEKVFPELVGTAPDGSKLLATDGLIAPLVLALQELVAEVRGAKNARKR